MSETADRDTSEECCIQTNGALSRYFSEASNIVSTTIPKIIDNYPLPTLSTIQRSSLSLNCTTINSLPSGLALSPEQAEAATAVSVVFGGPSVLTGQILTTLQVIAFQQLCLSGSGLLVGFVITPDSTLASNIANLLNVFGLSGDNYLKQLNDLVLNREERLKFLGEFDKFLTSSIMGAFSFIRKNYSCNDCCGAVVDSIQAAAIGTLLTVTSILSTPGIIVKCCYINEYQCRVTQYIEYILSTLGRKVCEDLYYSCTSSEDTETTSSESSNHDSPSSSSESCQWGNEKIIKPAIICEEITEPTTEKWTYDQSRIRKQMDNVINDVSSSSSEEQWVWKERKEDPYWNKHY